MILLKRLKTHVILDKKKSKESTEMAKYGRYDPRNKKKSRNKNLSLEKDLKIREQKNDKYKFNNIVVDELDEEYEDEYYE